MTDREARGMRFAIRFTRLRLQSFGAAVAQLGRKDSLPSGPFLCQVVVGHLVKLHSFHSGFSAVRHVVRRLDQLE